MVGGFQPRSLIWLIQMSRILTFPWHGPIQRDVVVLPNGGKYPYPQPRNEPLAQYGPGDTHLILVPNVPPLTDEEKASAPDGGEFWSGQAIISGDSLYGKSLGGWIYQAFDGSRWRIEFVTRAIGVNSSKLQLKASRFGDFGVLAESYIMTFNVPVGRASAETRQKVFADLGSPTDVTMRLHAVSNTGTNAIIAWMAFNRTDTDSLARDTDGRPKAYLFYQVSLSGSGADLAGEGKIVFDIDDIVSVSSSSSGGARVSMGTVGLDEVTSRKPVYDEQGIQIGETLTREYPASVASTPGNDWPGGSGNSLRYEWLLQVSFDGEDITPWYLKVRNDSSVSGANFSIVTTKPWTFYLDFIDQLEYTVENGEAYSNGAVSSTGTFTVSIECGGKKWSHTSQFSSSVVTNHFVETRTSSLDGISGVDSGSAGGAVYISSGDGDFTGARSGRLPTAAVGFARPKIWSFILYSNNLIGITYQFSDEPAYIQGAFTVDGYIDLEAPIKVPADYRHFGSYNPVTKKLIVGSLEPVNWA